MGRPRSKYTCPKCKQPGYKEHNASRNGNYKNSKYRRYWRVVHYDSLTKTKKFCYVDCIILEMENKELILAYKRKLEKIATTSPTEFQNFGIELDQQQKHLRNNMKNHKELYEYVARKYNIPLPKE